MRSTVCLALVFGMVVSVHAVTPSVDNVLRPELRPMGHYENPGPRVQGDAIDDPFIIDAIPFAVSGSTCGFNNDYDAACPQTGSTAPDVVYSYAAGVDIGVTIDLCNSTYDTKVYVYEDVVGIPIACNDDYCSWQSYLTHVPLLAGHTYHIVLDGYGASCGTYDLQVSEYIPCVLECPPGSMPEGEPICYDGYFDYYNGGCQTLSFQELEPACEPVVICGTTGVWASGSFLYRETDWFQLDLTEGSSICLAGDAEVPLYFFIIDGRLGCSGIEIVTNAIAGACAPLSGFCWFCDPGTWWMWAAPTHWDLTTECGTVYWMEITGYTEGLSPAGGTTWGAIKRLFD